MHIGECDSHGQIRAIKHNYDQIRVLIVNMGKYRKIKLNRGNIDK